MARTPFLKLLEYRRAADGPTASEAAPRCPYAFERCPVETPLLQPVAASQLAACHLYPDNAVLPPLPASADLPVVAPAAEPQAATP
jgi:hypothetical protein